MSMLREPWAPRGTVRSGLKNTATTGIAATETAYAALADLAVGTVDSRLYEVKLTIHIAMGTAGDSGLIRIRNGGASAPTALSTLLFEANWVAPAAGALDCRVYIFEWAPSTGTNRLGVFGVRNTGASNLTLGSTIAGRWSSLTVRDLGLA